MNTRLILSKPIKPGAAAWLGGNGMIISIDFTHEKQSQEGLAFGPISLAHFISNLKTVYIQLSLKGIIISKSEKAGRITNYRII